MKKMLLKLSVHFSWYWVVMVVSCLPQDFQNWLFRLAPIIDTVTTRVGKKNYFTWNDRQII